MPKVVVQKSTSLPPNEVFSKVSDVLKNDGQLKKLDSSYDCTFDASTLSGHAKGKLFKADMKVQAKGQGSEVTISVDLPLTLALAKGLVQKTLQQKLDENLT